ncbi:hypothetical protein [Roseimarinus sediminis]|uniref:hypothetical protein n=1 Tax=Roseimarinus sediminis TaxID=1610899 RepID=UPI003D1E222A
MRKNMIEIILVSALAIGVFSYRLLNNKDEQEIMKKGEFAIGTVVGISKTGWYSRANVSFSFYCDTQKIVKPLSKYPSNIKVQRDERFLVTYLPNNQKKAIMLFDYPIKDSTDYKRYVKEFEQKRMQKQE